jgi:atypical dual specificity phosphatase
MTCGQVVAAGVIDYNKEVPDWSAPTQNQIRAILSFTDRMISQHNPVAISCGYGYGRTGTLLSCYFVKRGVSADEAVEEVRRRGRTPYETEQQLEAIRDFEVAHKRS